MQDRCQQDGVEIVQGNASILRFALCRGGKPRPAYTLHRLPPGAGLGIREIVAARSSFLTLAGNAGSEPSQEYPVTEDYGQDRDFVLFAWDGTGTTVHRIGALPKVEGKAEAMTVLEETPDSVTVLVLCDGSDRGRPTVYRVS